MNDDSNLNDGEYFYVCGKPRKDKNPPRARTSYLYRTSNGDYYTEKTGRDPEKDSPKIGQGFRFRRCELAHAAAMFVNLVHEGPGFFMWALTREQNQKSALAAPSPPNGKFIAYSRSMNGERIHICRKDGKLICKTDDAQAADLHCNEIAAAVAILAAKEVPLGIYVYPDVR